MYMQKLAGLLVLNLLLGRCTVGMAQTETVVAPDGRPVFEVHYVQPGTTEMGVEASYELNDKQKQYMKVGIEYWTDILGKGTEQLLPVYIGSYEAGNANAVSYYYDYKEKYQSNGFDYADFFYGREPVEYEDGQIAININIGKYLGQVGTADYGWTFLPATHLALNGWQADYVATIRHEMGHALGITSNKDVYVDEQSVDGVLPSYAIFSDNINQWARSLISENGNRAKPGAVIVENAADVEKTVDFFIKEGYIQEEDRQQAIKDAFVGKKLYLTGSNISSVLNGKTFDGVDGLPVNGWEWHSYGEYNYKAPEFAHVELGMMSHIPYCNYTTFTEVDLAMMQDLGYQLDRRNYYGYSIYDDGRTVSNNNPYYARNEEGTAFINGKYNETALGVGLHIFGSSNDVTQKADILTRGTGAVGIRVDGSGNTLTVDKSAAVHADGVYGIGLLTSYGSGQKISQNGTVSAVGAGGIGARFDFGSSSNGWYDEYRGSYIRFNRYLRGNGTLENNQELGGALVERYDINGSLAGQAAAVYIGTNAYVKEINVLQGGINLQGDIVSRWNPNLKIDVLDGYGNVLSKDMSVVQYDGDNNTLTTDLNFYAQNMTYNGNIDSRIGGVESGMEFAEVATAGEGEIGKTINLNIRSGASMFYNGTADVLHTAIEKNAALSGADAVFNSTVENHGALLPVYNAAKNESVVINGDLQSDGTLGVAANLYQSSPMRVNGSADIAGSTLAASPGSLYLPGVSYTYLEAESLNGKLGKQDYSSFTGLMDIEKVEAAGKAGSVTLRFTASPGDLSARQGGSWAALSRMSLNESLDRTAAAHILSLPEKSSGSALAAMAGGAQMDNARQIQTNNTVGRVLNARMGDAMQNGSKTVEIAIPALDASGVTAQVQAPVKESSEYSWWGKTTKSWSRNGSSGSSHSSTLMLGLDKSFSDSMRGGFFAGYGNAKLAGSAFNLKTDDYRVGVYGLYLRGADEGECYFDYGVQKNKGTRYVADLAADSNYSSRTWELGGEWRHDFDFASGRQWHKKLFAGLSAVRYNQEGYMESGSIGILGQATGKMKNVYTAGRIGLELATTADAYNDLRLRVGYRRDFSGANPEMEYSFIGDGSRYTVRGAENDKDFLIFGVNGNHKFDENWSVNMDLWLERGAHDRNLTAGLTLKRVW